MGKVQVGKELLTGAVKTGKIIKDYFDEGVETLGDVKDYVEDLISKGIIFKGSHVCGNIVGFKKNEERETTRPIIHNPCCDCTDEPYGDSA